MTEECDQLGKISVSCAENESMNQNLNMPHSFRLPRQIQTAIALGLAFSIACGITLSLSIVEPVEGLNGFFSACDQICKSFPAHSVASGFPFIWAGIAAMVLSWLHVKKGVRIWRIGLAAFFGFAMTAGFALQETGDLCMLIASKAQLVKSIWAFASWGAVFYFGVEILFFCLDRFECCNPVKASHTANGKKLQRAIGFVFESHAFLGPCLVIITFWLPVLIGFAPGLFMGDSTPQLSMWYGLESSRSRATILVSENVTMTTHYPIFHTMLFGACVQLGDMLSNANLGVFFYTLIQFFITVMAISYAHLESARLGVPMPLRVLCILFVSLVPWFAGYAVLVTRDTLFSDALLVFCIDILVFCSGRNNRALVGVLCMSAVMVSLFRSGGFLFSCVGLIAIFLVLVIRKRSLRETSVPLCAIAAMCFVNVLISFALIPALQIAPANRIEALSIPVQQTARFVRDYPDDITDDERVAVDAVLALDGLGDRYDPNTSDPVKDYAAINRRNATSNDWRHYFEAWLSMGARHPDCYALSVLNNYYGYFYPSKYIPQFYGYSWSATCMERANSTIALNIHPVRLGFVQTLARIDTAYVDFWRRAPIFQLFMKSAFWCWLLVLATAYSAHRRWWFMIPVLAVLWSILLVVFIGPCNGTTYNRYVYPIAFTLPFVLAIATSSMWRKTNLLC